MFNASLLLQDEQTRTTWNHYQGLGLDGPLEGHLLERIPTFHATWRNWLAMHPDTKVVAEPENPHHRDCRDGHGSEESFGRAGLNPMFCGTVVRPIDTRLPENELVVVATRDEETRIYPITELKRHGSVVNDELGGAPIVVWAGPASDGFTAGAFERGQEDPPVFELSREGFVDQKTKSLWNVEGHCVQGPRKGDSLAPLDFTFLRWHGWAWGHRNNRIWRSSRTGDAPVELGVFEELVQALRQADYDLLVEHEVVDLLRPNEATRGLALRINGDPMRLWSFPDASAARDHVEVGSHAVRIGSFVLESHPETAFRFVDGMHSRMRRDDQVPWSKLLKEKDPIGQDFLAVLEKVAPREGQPPQGMGLVDAVHHLEAQGYEVTLGEDLRLEGVRTGSRIVTIPRGKLRVGALSGYILRIQGDRFLLYKFGDEGASRRYAEVEPHALAGGRFVLRSMPDDMYADPVELAQRPDAEVSWSKLLEEDAFRTAIGGLAGR